MMLVSTSEKNVKIIMSYTVSELYSRGFIMWVKIMVGKNMAEFPKNRQI